MKESEGSPVARKSPRRRMYQDAKFTTLLHPSNTQKFNGNFTFFNGIGNDEAAISFHTISNTGNTSSNTQKTDNSAAINSTNKRFERNYIPMPVRNDQFRNNSLHNGKSEATDEPKAKSISSDNAKKDKFKNPIFQKFLFNSTDQENDIPHSASQIHVSNDHKMVVESQRKPKLRSERRHTATGTNGLTIKEIEDWLSKEKEIAHVTKDDCAIIITPKVLPMRKAKTFSSFEWYEGRNSRLFHEKRNCHDVVTHDIELHDTAKKKKGENANSVKLSNDNANAEKHAYSTKADATAASVQSKRLGDIQLITSDTAVISETSDNDKILRNGINNRLSCFLSPRPFMKDQVKWKTMAQPRKSWNGYEDDSKTNEKGSHSTLEYNGIAPAATTASHTNYIADDDDDLIARAFPLRSPRTQTKYDTFLDLSNLELDDENSENLNGNGIAYSSDSEIDEDRNWGWEDENLAGEDERSSFDLHESLYHNFGDDISQTSARGPLEKIEEHPSEIDYATETQSQLSQMESSTSETTTDLDAYDSANPSGSATDATPRSNFEEASTSTSTTSFTNTQTSSCDTEQENEDLGEEETKSTCFSGLDTAALNNSNKDETFVGENSADASESESTKTTDSLESLDDASSEESQEYNLIEEELYKKFSISDKTASLDRYAFRKPINLKTPLVFQNKEKTDTAHNNVDSDSNISATEKTSLYLGLNRFYHIVLSTIKSAAKSDVKIQDVLEFIEGKGIRLTDPRLRVTMKRIEDEALGINTPLSAEAFSRVCEPSYNFIRGLLLSQVSIPGFGVFKMRMSRTFEKLQEILNQKDVGPGADINPSHNVIMKQLRNTKPVISLSVCTVDGQRCTFGDEDSPHPLNACATVFNYCLACCQNGIATVSYFLGNTSKPTKKSEFMLEEGEKVWNPFTKSGSILTSALLYREMETENRLKALHEYYQTLIGNETLCCDNLSYNYKRIYDHEEIGLAYFLSATQRLPRGTSADLTEFLDFHFQAASSAMTSDACAVGAATLANGGVCPLTGASVLAEASVEHTLSVMKKSHQLSESASNSQVDSMSAVWNDHGSVMIVIPGVLGIVCFIHCSSNTIQDIVNFFIKDLSTNFNFGVYRSLKDKRNLAPKR